jgi:hypothetical protein
MVVQPEARDRQEMACLRQKSFDVLKEIIREPLLLLFLRFDVVVKKLDSQLRRQLIV